MTCWALIPIKATQSGKSRLSGALGADERQALVGAMLAHVAEAAGEAAAVSRVLLVGSSRFGLPDAIELLPDPGQGHNPAVQSALEHIAEQGPDRLIVIAADLPAVTPGEIDLLAAAPADTVAIAPDRHGIGTNALSLPLPAASSFTFGFGPDSCAHHTREAKRLGLKAECIRSPGLEKDVDEPADLPDAGSLLETEGQDEKGGRP